MDRSPGRLDIPAAAAQLGLSAAAVRKRIQRHQLASVKVDGHVYVCLDRGNSPSNGLSNGPVPHETAPSSNGPDRSKSLSHPLAVQLAAAVDQITFLRAELERKDAIIMRLVEQRQPPALEPGPLVPPPRPWWAFWRR